MKINITDFGAVGDGKTLNTEAFRRACEAAKASQDAHSVIIVPPGTFLSGTIELPSDTTLFLEAGALLKASGNPEDYRENPYIFSNHTRFLQSKQYDYQALFFLGALNAKNIIIDGDGTIDGSGDNFWENVCFDGQQWIPNADDFPAHYRVLKARRPRPALLSFWKCSNLTIRNIRLINAAAYTIWPQGCVDVRIQNITVKNPYQGPNTDVLDIDCSENVIISGCNLTAGDDCIALKSDTARLGEDRPCRNIAVSNCILSSTACGIRIGYEGDGDITDCSFSNLVIHDTKNAIDMLSVTPVHRFDFLHGTNIERIQFTNISMHNVSRAFFIWAGTEFQDNPYKAHVSDITFADINANTCGGAFIGSHDGEPIRRVSMHNVHINFSEHPYFQALPPCDYPEIWAGARMPDILRLHRIEDLRLNDVQLNTDTPTGLPIQGAKLRFSCLANAKLDNSPLPADGTVNS